MVIKKQLQLTKDGTVNFIQLEIELINHHSPALAKEMTRSDTDRGAKLNLKNKENENAIFRQLHKKTNPKSN